MDLLIKNGKIVIDPDNILEGDISVHEGVITGFGDIKEHEAEKVIDAQGKYIMPGFVNTHTHLFQSMLKGLGRDLELINWLNASIRPNVPQFTKEDFYYAALLGAMDSVMTGTTTVVDFMYANILPEASSYVCKALDDLGVRAVMGRGFIDRYLGDEGHDRLVEKPEDILEKVRALQETYRENERINIGISAGVSWAINEEGFIAISNFAKENGVMIAMHTSETPYDDNDAIVRFGTRLFPYLEKIGFLGDWLTAVHCVTLDDRDIELISEYGVKVSYNPVSNMILGSGIAPVEKLRKHGVIIGLGTDGAASNDSQDMLEVMKFAALLQKVADNHASALPASEVFKMATINGAHCAGLGNITGSIHVGKKADLVIYNPDKIKSTPVYNPVTSLVYSSDSNNIETVIVNGAVIFDHGEFKRVNIEDVIAWGKQAAKKFAGR